MPAALDLKAGFDPGRNRRRILQVSLKTGNAHDGLFAITGKQSGTSWGNHDDRVFAQGSRDYAQSQFEPASRTGADSVGDKIPGFGLDL
jgi:hypothetical protein